MRPRDHKLRNLKAFLIRKLVTAGFKLLRRTGYKTNVTFKTLLLKRCLENPAMKFLQIGANDGATDDPINYFVERFQMSGTCIEPQKQVFEKLQSTYRNNRRIELLNAAIAPAGAATVTLYKVRDGAFPDIKQNASGLATFNKAILLSHESMVPGLKENMETEEVKAIELRQVLNPEKFAQLDLLVIDTEGYDFEIIKMIDFDSVAPIMIYYEHKHLPDEQRIECINYLSARGYNILVEAADTTAFKREFM